MSTQYLLHVINIQDVRWNSRFRSKLPDLYVLARLGDVSKQTQIVKRNLSPTWNELLTISSSGPATDLVIELRHKSILKSDPCVGFANIKLDQLLNVNTEDEANRSTPVFLHKKGSNDPAGTLHLRLEIVDLMSGVGNDLQTATQDIQRVKQTEAGALTTTGIADSIAQPSTGSNLYTSIADLLSKLGVFIKLVDELSKIHPYLTVAWQVASFLFKGVSNQFKADKEIIDLFILMVKAFNFVRDTDSLPNKSRNLEETIINLLKQTTECCLLVKHYVRHGFVGRMLDVGLKAKIGEFYESFIALKNALDSGIGLHTAFVSARILDKVDVMHLQLRLNPDKMSAFNRPLCLPGTRMTIQSQIIDWAVSDTDENIFWLHGVAGSGKSTISTTIAEHFRGLHRLGAFLFFERGKSDPSSVIRTLSFGIACADSNIAKRISIAIELDHGIASASATSQFDALILKPLIASAEDLRGPILIVLDALDECGTLETRRTLMELFRERISSIPKNIRILITSRRETDIERALSSQPDTVQMVELDYTSEDSRRDVLAYLRVEMGRRVKDEVAIPEDWPWEANMKLLADAAEGLFVWASTAVKLVSSHMDDPFQKLKDIVTDLRSPSAFGLHDLYSNVLRNCGISWDSGASRARFVQVMGLILLGKTPLSVATIDGILGYPPEKSSSLVLSRLQCLLAYSLDTPIHLFHTSFSDYLMSPKRSADPWLIDISSQMTYITMRCFSVMKDMLHFNMCNLESSFLPNGKVKGLQGRIEENIPPHLVYPCLYWSQHLSGSPNSPSLLGALSEFLYNRLLYWFEVLSLLKKVGIGDRALFDAFKWSESSIEGLSEYLTDARKLLTMFSIPISQSTPHIYMTMLPLTSQEFEVSGHYSKGISSLVSIERSGNQSSAPLLRSIRLGMDYLDKINSIAFTLDCTRIALGSSDGSLYMYEVAGGEIVFGPIKGHIQNIPSLAFSSDGTRVISGSYDRTIRIWNAANGESMVDPLRGHTSGVTTVAFSSDGSRVVSGSLDKTIIIWDSWNGKIVSGPFQRHTEAVLAAAFSPDGTRIVSGSEDCTLILWNFANGDILLSSEGLTSSVSCVNFSPDGSHVISGFSDGAIRIWNTSTGALTARLLEEGKEEVECVNFSPTGSYIVFTRAWDRSIRIWDAKGGKDSSEPLIGHTDDVRFASFSQDGTRIASYSWNGEVGIWDVAEAEALSKSSRSYSGEVVLATYTPDGKHVMSICDDNIVRIWDIRSGLAASRVLHGSDDRIACTDLSSDGTRVVSGSYNGTVMIRDIENGKAVCGPVLDHTRSTWFVQFSPDNTRIIFGFYDETIKVWDTESTKTLYGPFYQEYIFSAVFSPDGTRIVTGFSNGTMVVYEVETGIIVAGPFNGHTGTVNCIVFSPCGTQLASGSEDRTIRIWDFESRQIINSPFEGHTLAVISISFSSDGLRIVSGSVDKTVRVWSVSSGELIFGPFIGHSDDINSVEFSPDGTSVVSGSADGIIRIWDITETESDTIAATTVTSSSDQKGATNWTLAEDGWVCGENGELLLWIPPALRPTLWHPRNTAIFGGNFQNKLDFSNCTHGERWKECFKLPSC